MKTFLKIVAVLFLLIIAFAAYEGAFKSASAKETHEGGYTLLGIEHRGAYNKIGIAFQTLRENINKLNLKNVQYAGVYFDDPKTVAEDSLHSMAAVIITNPIDSAKIAQMTIGAQKMKLHKIAEGNAIVVDTKTCDMFSTMFAAIKAYPAMAEYAKKHPQKTAPKDFYELYKDGETRFIMQF
jgi:hypothetical protein